MITKEIREILILTACKAYFERKKLNIGDAQNLQSLKLDLDYIEDPIKPKKKEYK